MHTRTPCLSETAFGSSGREATLDPTAEPIRSVWKERLELAKIRLQFAIQSMKSMEEEQRAGRLPADSSILLEYATRALTELRREYLRIAGIYLDLVQYGKIPSEQASPQQLATGFMAQIQAAPTSPALALPEPKSVILIVDDNPSVRSVLQAMVEQAGYPCLVAASGEEALALSRSYAGEIRLLITDMDMPHMNGMELARQLMGQRPNILVLMITGHGAGEIGGANIDLPILKKPFVPRELWRRLEELLATKPPGKPPT